MSDTALHAVPAARPASGLWARLRRHVARIDAAHARQARFASLTGEEARDTGLSGEHLLGESAHDPALPFFFQSGFARR